MTLDQFKEAFSNLNTDDKVSIYNEYCTEYGDSDNYLNDFNEDFFNTFFSDNMEVCRATFFGNIESWNDEYIRFNAYGNLESLDEFKAEEEIECYLEEIFDHKELWESYIDETDYIDEDEDDEDDEDEPTE